MYIYTYTVHCFDRITDDKQFVSTTLWMSEWCKQIANKVVHPGGLLERSLGEIQNLSSPMVPQKKYVPSMCPNPTGFSSPLPAKIAQNKLNALSHVSWEYVISVCCVDMIQ